MRSLMCECPFSRSQAPSVLCCVSSSPGAAVAPLGVGTAGAAVRGGLCSPLGWVQVITQSSSAGLAKS